MIGQDKRKAIFLLHLEGMGVRDIARNMAISPTTVMDINEQKGEMPETVRKDKIQIDLSVLENLYETCQGRAQRVYEKLTEEEGIDVGYSTLTRMLREQGLSHKSSSRCEQVPDKPGAEMQHDTSPYRIKLGKQIVLLQGSLLYFRYCKIRYLKFYRSFNRFKMKCFLHEALSYWEYAAGNSPEARI